LIKRCSRGPSFKQKLFARARMTPPCPPGAPKMGKGKGAKTPPTGKNFA